MTDAPFNDIRQLLKDLPVADDVARAKTHARAAQMVMPAHGLGRLEEIAAWLSAWTGKIPPMVNSPVIAVFASDNGLAAYGGAAAGTPTTAQMMELIAAGGGGVSVLAQQAGAALKIFDLAIGRPTPDCVLQDAMSERDCVATMAFGMEVLAQGHDCLILSHLSSGGEAIAATLALALYGGEPQDWFPVRDIVDGLSDNASTLEMTQAIGAAAKRATATGHDPLALLCAVGGREIAAIAGAILAARLQRIPVILDGYPACVAGAVLQSINPQALDHCLMAQWDGSPAHARLLEKLGHEALLGLSIFDGAGAAGALALQVVKAALACHAGMATYEQAGLTGPN